METTCKNCVYYQYDNYDDGYSLVCVGSPAGYVSGDEYFAPPEDFVCNDFKPKESGIRMIKTKDSETPKRCDMCRRWKLSSTNNLFGFCNNGRVKGMALDHIVLPPADFYCKYWEKKEER